jgi:hypothetical protein
MPKKKSTNPRSNPLITDYGQFWERIDLFDVKNGRVNWHSRTWPDGKVKPPLASRGIYILYRGTTPVYVGKGTSKIGIAKRLQGHAQDWYAHAWDNVCWYVFDKKQPEITIDVVEALLIASIPGLLNSAQPCAQLGKKHYPGGETNSASNTLWKNKSG